ncbi:MAG: hypothetical protein HYV45_01150 [Candidatus Moranbacteria bacterium]|nr:hypothetical protein [Candidatus Moranbacteria bacterium]
MTKKEGSQDFSHNPYEQLLLVSVDAIYAAGSAAAEAKSEAVMCDVIFLSATFLAPFCLYFFVSRHRCTATASRPVGLFAEDSWIWLAPLVAGVFPLRPVVQAHAVATLTVCALLACKIAMVHSSSPFWLPVFLGTNYIYTQNRRKVNSFAVKVKKSARSCLLKK